MPALRNEMHIDDAAERLCTTRDGIRSLASRELLDAMGSNVTITSVERYERTRPSRLGQHALALRARAFGNDVPYKAGFRNAATAIASEQVGVDGGLLTTPEHRDEVAQPLENGPGLAPRCPKFTAKTNALEIPVDLTAPWSATTGPTTQLVSEAAAIPQSKPDLTLVTAALEKHAGIVPVTEEIIQDAPSVGNYLRRAISSSLSFSIDTIIIGGVVHSPATIEVAPEGSQAAKTFNAVNVADMATRSSALDASTWVMTKDTLPSLAAMAATSPSLVSFDSDGEREPGEIARVMGRPAILNEACSELGHVGDSAIFRNTRCFSKSHPSKN